MTVSLLDVRFLAALTAVCLLRLLWPRKYYVLPVTIASAALVALAAPATFVLIAGIALGYVYPFHRLMRRLAASGRRGSFRLVLYLSVAGLVALLILYKLNASWTHSALSRSWLDVQALSLVGFSYFIFRAISFLHIQSILDIDERTPWAVAYYLLFPPTLTSGPIQKFQDFKQQLSSPAPLTFDNLGTSLYRITRGYFRKVVIAYPLYGLVETLLATPTPTAYTSILIILILYVYFYADFAGYSDIAIGFGLLIGIRVPENFRTPFLATSVTEFWRNWHITLGDWFRDQVFIPLGGMGAGRLRAGATAFLIMLLCGLWHGLTYAFLIWGLWHGSMLFIEAISGARPMPPSKRVGWPYWSRVAWTNARVAVAAVLFLPDPAATLRVLQGFTRWL